MGNGQWGKGVGIDEKRGIKKNCGESGAVILVGAKTLWTISCHCVVSLRGLFAKTLHNSAAGCQKMSEGTFKAAVHDFYKDIFPSFLLKLSLFPD